MKEGFLIKICGMKFPENAKEVSELPVSVLGFIFYPPSKRDVSFLPCEAKARLFAIPENKAGVFVNEKIETVKETAQKYNFGFIQLHGEETPEYCCELKLPGIKIIKAFGINESFDFREAENFEGAADYFLFDTRTESRGGSGKKFSWGLLEKYQGKTPFILSGGIGPGDAEAIAGIVHPGFSGIDLNSGFEDSPGLKNIEKLKTFINTLKQQTR